MSTTVRDWELLDPPGEWTIDAACADPQYVWAANAWTDPTTVNAAALPIAICGTCPVAHECLHYGKSIDAYGVWGGKLLRNGMPI